MASGPATSEYGPQKSSHSPRGVRPSPGLRYFLLGGYGPSALQSWLSLAHRGGSSQGETWKPSHRLLVPTTGWRPAGEPLPILPFSPLPSHPDPPTLTHPTHLLPSPPWGVSPLSGCLKELPAPRAGGQNRKTVGEHRKGENPPKSGWPLSTDPGGSQPGESLLSAEAGRFLERREPCSPPFQANLPVPKNPQRESPGGARMVCAWAPVAHLTGCPCSSGASLW